MLMMIKFAYLQSDFTVDLFLVGESARSYIVGPVRVIESVRFWLGIWLFRILNACFFFGKKMSINSIYFVWLLLNLLTGCLTVHRYNTFTGQIEFAAVKRPHSDDHFDLVVGFVGHIGKCPLRSSNRAKIINQKLLMLSRSTV